MKTRIFMVSIWTLALALFGCSSDPASAPIKSAPLVTENTAIAQNKEVGLLPPGYTLKTVPAKYSKATLDVVVVPATVEYETIPPKFKWVDGLIEGTWAENVPIVPWSETYSKTYLYQAPSIELVMEPAPDDKDRSSATPTRIIEQSIPAIYKSYDVKSWKTAGPAVTKTVPFEHKEGKTRVPISKPQAIEKVVPAVLKQVETMTLAHPPIYIVFNGNGTPLHEFGTIEEVRTFLKSHITP